MVAPLSDATLVHLDFDTDTGRDECGGDRSGPASEALWEQWTRLPAFGAEELLAGLCDATVRPAKRSAG